MHTLFAISSAAVLATNLMAANAQVPTVHPTLQLDPAAHYPQVIDQGDVIAKSGTGVTSGGRNGSGRGDGGGRKGNGN